MNVAEMVIRGKKDFDAVYEAGYERGQAESGSYDQGYADGQKAEYDRIVDESKIIEKSATGLVVRVDGVSEIPHKCKVTLHRKNMILYPYPDTTKTLNGLTFTDNGDGTITIDGTASAGTTFNLAAWTKWGLKHGETYTASVSHASGSYTGTVPSVVINYYPVGATNYSAWLSVTVTSSKTGVCPIDLDSLRSYLYVPQGTVCNSLVICPQLEEGTIATAYESYIDPQPANLTVCGKNIADPTLIEGFHTGTNICYAYTNGLLLPKGTYTATVIADISYVANFNIRRHDNTSVIVTGGVDPITFTLTEPTVICWNANLGDPVTKDNYKSALRVQIESGTVATTYEPYIRFAKNLIDPVRLLETCESHTTLDGDVFTTTFRSGGIHVNYLYDKRVHFPKGTYTFSFIPLTEGANVALYVYRKSDSSSIVSNKKLNASNPSYTFTADEDFRPCLAGNLDYLGTYSYKLQLEVGTTATEYEPYKDPTPAIAVGQPIELDSICSTMTLYTDNDATITLDYRKSYGVQTEYDRFWDALQQNGNKTNYDCLFYFDHWTDETYNPKHPIRCENNTNAGRQVFSGSWQITDIKVPIYAKNTRLVYTFQNCNRLKTIPLLYVEGVTDFNSCFVNCDALENITMAGAVNKSIGFAQSKLLTEQSVQSIIDVLADLTGQTAQTLTFHAGVGARLTEAQKAAITAKNWILVY